MSSSKEPKNRSKKDRGAVATALAHFCALSKKQKTAFFDVANVLVFLSPKGQQDMFKELDRKGIAPSPEDLLIAAGHRTRS